jgi:hypothetical protein
MVFYNHLDRRKNISEKINIDQAALRTDPLDSLRSRKGDRISDSHPQSLNVDRALNREVHGKNRNRLIIDNEIDVDRKLVTDANKYLREINYSRQNRKLD